jgi:cytoskeletal protein RodZ
MSTKDIEKTETIPATPENEPSENKRVFGPLGKYAVIAVLMVSIIVTTAIMLNKQLGSVDEQLAAMENEVAEISDANTSDHASSVASDAKTTSTADIVVAEDVPVAVEAPVVTETPVTSEKAVSEQTTEVVEIATVEKTATEASSNEAAVANSSEASQA